MTRHLFIATALVVACTPDIATDPVSELMEFDPSGTPPRVSEPSFAVINRTTGRIDLGLVGIEVPPDCRNQTVMPEAQCEFDQYLESLDGFPTVAGARAPVSAAVDSSSATVPGNVAVVEARSGRLVDEVDVGFDAATRYLQVGARKSWPVGGFIWMGVRGYEDGIRADGKRVVASVVYNLLKREDSLTCGASSPTAIEESCRYLELLSSRLEPLRQAMLSLRAWEIMETVGGIPKAEVAMLWGFPVQSGPVIDLNPRAGLQPQVAAADEMRLPVNGEVDPTTVTAFRLGTPGTVYFVNLTALAAGDLPGGFPTVTASVSGGAIIIKGAAAFERGKNYGIFITRGVKTIGGKSLVRPPISVFLMSRGKLVGDDRKSTVSSLADQDAFALEMGRQQLAPLLDNPFFVGVTGLEREEIAYLYAFPLGAP